MKDPRKDRTKDFVLSCTSRLLADEGPDAVTFSRVSRESRVARSTLYRYWKSRDELICAASLPGFSTDGLDADSGSEQFLVQYLSKVSEGLVLPETVTAFARALQVSGTDPVAEQNFQSVTAAFHRLLEERLGPIDPWDHARIVGPVFFRALVMREPTDRATIGRWVEDVLVWSGDQSVRDSGTVADLGN